MRNNKRSTSDSTSRGTRARLLMSMAITTYGQMNNARVLRSRFFSLVSVGLSRASSSSPRSARPSRRTWWPASSPIAVTIIYSFLFAICFGRPRLDHDLRVTVDPAPAFRPDRWPSSRRRERPSCGRPSFPMRSISESRLASCTEGSESSFFLSFFVFLLRPRVFQPLPRSPRRNVHEACFRKEASAVLSAQARSMVAQCRRGGCSLRLQSHRNGRR